MPKITPTPSWRDVLPVHPAADLFPLMTPEELKALGEDIKQNGLRLSVVLWAAGPPQGDAAFQLLDGRNRLDAAETAGLEFGDALPRAAHLLFELHRDGSKWIDPYEYVLSANVHRRHLTPDQKRDLIAKVLKAQPEKSNRSIAKQTKADHKTVGVVRDRLEATGEIPQLSKTVGADGKARQQPAARTPRVERHVCWQCGTRDEVGKVEEYYCPDLEDAGVWLHPTCVDDFEKKRTADRAEAAAAAAADDPDIVSWLQEWPPDKLARQIVALDDMQPGYALDVIAALDRLRPRPAPDGLDIPPFLDRRTARAAPP